MKNIITLTGITILAGAICYAQNTYVYSQPGELGDGWSTGHIRSQVIDTTGIYRLFTQLLNGENKIHSVLLVKNEQLVIEEYFNGQQAGQQHDLRSATKGIISILTGIALEKGFIGGIDDPISKYLKIPVSTKNNDRGREKITVGDLLTMSSGFDCDDWDPNSEGQEDTVYKKKDWIQYTLGLPMANEPGTVAMYCSMGVVLIAEIISRASGMTIDRFAERFLFSPLGITNLSWDHTSRKKVIDSGKRLHLTSRDMSKIGLLVLNGGKWGGNQVVSEKWINDATSPKTTIAGMDYGYLWWSIPFEVNKKVLVSKTATGNGGQYIMVFPELDLVAVFTGGAYNSPDDKLPFAIMTDIFLPTFMAKEY